MIIVPELDIFLNELILDYFSEGDVNRGLINAALIGDIQLVEFFISNGAFYYCVASYCAAKNNHTHLINHLIDTNIYNYEWGSYVATQKYYSHL